MCTLKKDDNIILEGDTCVSANTPTLLAGGKYSGLVAFLNNFDLVVYASEAFGIINLTGTWAFITPNKLQKWDVYHAYQDIVSILLYILWMACLKPVKRSLLENKPNRPNTTFTSFPNPSTQHIYTWYTRPTFKSINKGQTNSGSIQFNASTLSMTVPLLDPKHLHILWSFNYTLDSKSSALRHPWDIFMFFMPLFQNAVFWQTVIDITTAISIANEILYILNLDMEY